MTKSSHRQICITRTEQEQLLCAEASSLNPAFQCNELARGVVELSGPDPESFSPFYLFFAPQILPHAVQVLAPSIKGWVTALSDHLSSYFGDAADPWMLHIFEPSSAESGKEYSRAKLIRQETLGVLKQKRRTLLKSLRTNPDPEATLVQLVLQSPTEGWLSVSAPKLCKALAPTLSPFVAGHVNIADDTAPPSRAFKKLREAILVFGLPFERGMSCADLGASPGGWTQVLRDHGCSVVAVDRSPLAPHLMKDRLVTFERADAFRWAPKQQLDWMVCDVIATPDKTVHLIERWLKERLCKAFCCTIKFKGSPDFGALAEVRSVLAQHCSRHSGKQLTHNKNELTVVGFLRD